jgi:hypothetical protein
MTLSVDQTGSLTLGTSDTITVGIPGQNVGLSFSGTAGGQVSLQVTGSTFPGGCNSQLILSILNPGGGQLASANMCSGGAVGLSAITLPSTGTYVALLAPQNGGTGSATVLLTSP